MLCRKKMPIPSLQLRKKPSHAERQRNWSRELWSPRCSGCALQLCYVTAANPWTIVEIELLATVGWKWGCQPFSCLWLKNMTHSRKENLCDIFGLRNPFLPLIFENSTHPLPTKSFRVPESGSTLCILVASRQCLPWDLLWFEQIYWECRSLARICADAFLGSLPHKDTGIGKSYVCRGLLKTG